MKFWKKKIKISLDYSKVNNIYINLEQCEKCSNYMYLKENTDKNSIYWKCDCGKSCSLQCSKCKGFMKLAKNRALYGCTNYKGDIPESCHETIDYKDIPQIITQIKNNVETLKEAPKKKIIWTAKKVFGAIGVIGLIMITAIVNNPSLFQSFLMKNDNLASTEINEDTNPTIEKKVLTDRDSAGQVLGAVSGTEEQEANKDSNAIAVSELLDEIEKQNKIKVAEPVKVPASTEMVDESERIANVKRTLKALDTDDDGYSDYDELMGGYDPYGPDDLTEEEAAKLEYYLFYTKEFETFESTSIAKTLSNFNDAISDAMGSLSMKIAEEEVPTDAEMTVSDVEVPVIEEEVPAVEETEIDSEVDEEVPVVEETVVIDSEIEEEIPADAEMTSSNVEVPVEVVKFSESGICHIPGSTYYDRTTNFAPYDTVEECLRDGGRMPKR